MILVHSSMGSAESIESRLAGQKLTLRLSVAVVKVYSGIFCVDHTVPLSNALVLRWLLTAHSQLSTLEGTESTFAGQKSTLRLPVTAVKV